VDVLPGLDLQTGKSDGSAAKKIKTKFEMEQ